MRLRSAIKVARSIVSRQIPCKRGTAIRAFKRISTNSGWLRAAIMTSDRLGLLK